MNIGLIHHRRGKAFIFLYEGGANQFAEFLERWNIRYQYTIDLSTAEIKVLIL